MSNSLIFMNSSNRRVKISKNDEKNIYNSSNKLINFQTTINNLYNFNKFNDLGYLRQQGYCYIVNTFYNKNFNTTTSLDDLLIYNDSSDKKAFIYDIDVNFLDVNALDANLNLNVDFTGNKQTNNLQTAQNLKLDGSTLPNNNPNGNVFVCKNPSVISDGNIYKMNIRTSSNTTKEYYHKNLFQNEFIELPENRGIVIGINSSTANFESSFSINVKFIVLPNNYETNYVIFK